MSNSKYEYFVSYTFKGAGFGCGSVDCDLPITSFNDVQLIRDGFEQKHPAFGRIIILNFQLLRGPSENGWVSVHDEPVTPEDEDVLILLENGKRGIGSIFETVAGDLRMRFNGTGMVLDRWDSKPQAWCLLPALAGGE